MSCGVRAATAGRPYVNTVLIPLAVITPLSPWRGVGGEAVLGLRLFGEGHGGEASALNKKRWQQTKGRTPRLLPSL